jgi:hypothetical protein
MFVAPVVMPVMLMTVMFVSPLAPMAMEMGKTVVESHDVSD